MTASQSSELKPGPLPQAGFDVGVFGNLGTLPMFPGPPGDAVRVSRAEARQGLAPAPFRLSSAAESSPATWLRPSADAGSEAELAPGPFRRAHQRLQCREHLEEPAVVDRQLAFEFGKLEGEPPQVGQHPAHPDERLHHEDADLDRAVRAEHARQHDGSVFGEGEGRC